MSAALIAQLLATFGPSAITLIDGLIKKSEASGDVSFEEWAILSKDARKSSLDVMLEALKDSGIDPTSPQGVALLAAAK